MKFFLLKNIKIDKEGENDKINKQNNDKVDFNFKRSQSINRVLFTQILKSFFYSFLLINFESIF